MLQNAPYYWGSVRKVVESFGALFSDLHIVRYKADGTVYQTLQVPIAYGPKEKWLVRNTQNPTPTENDPVEMVLPRMSYEMSGGWQYDSSRQLTATGRTVQVIQNDNRILKGQFNPVPYNFGFTLHIMAKNVEDGLMIVEQILPFFTPDYTITHNDMPELGLKKDIAIVHGGTVQHEDSWDGSFQERRVITWSLDFVVKAFLYPPVKTNKVVLESDVYYKVAGTDEFAGELPVAVTVPDPLSARADTVQKVKTYITDTTVLVLVDAEEAALAGGETETFQVRVINTSNSTVNVLVPNTVHSANDTYNYNATTGIFTYTVGIGARTIKETLKIYFYSAADVSRRGTLTLTLTP